MIIYLYFTSSSQAIPFEEIGISASEESFRTNKSLKTDLAEIPHGWATASPSKGVPLTDTRGLLISLLYITGSQLFVSISSEISTPPNCL